MSFNKKTKVDFVEAIYTAVSETNPKIQKGTVKTIVDSLITEMKQSLIDGQQIELRGFGTFEFRYRKPKLNARNPRSGKRVAVEGHSIVAFRAGNHLRKTIWGTIYGNKDSELKDPSLAQHTQPLPEDNTGDDV